MATEMTMTNAMGPFVVAALQPSMLHTSQNSVFMCLGVKFSRHSSIGASFKIEKSKKIKKYLFERYFSIIISYLIHPITCSSYNKSVMH